MVRFVPVWALILVSAPTGDGSEDISRLLEEKELLQQQVQQLQEEIRVQASGEQYDSGRTTCTYVEKQVVSMQMIANEKDKEISSLQEQLQQIRQSFDQRQPTSCVQNRRLERYSNRRVAFKGNYTFPVKSIPKLRYDEPETMEHLLQGKPVVITDSELTQPACTKWNLDYLARQLDQQNVRMFVSKNRQFRYHSNMNNTQYYKWTSPYETRTGRFNEFVEIVHELDKVDNGSRTYFQFLLNDLNLTKELDDDVAAFHWNWLYNTILPQVKWGDLKHNLLLVGMHDVTTPVHYDGMENLFAMISGHKRCILFNPSQYRSLYPFPAHHPHDRQSQVDFDNPNFDMFPRFREAHGYETILEPGEVLYIPSHWWHYIESEENSMTISLNFWFEPSWQNELSKNKQEDSYENDIKADIPQEVEELILKRDIEMMIAETTHPLKVADFLREILDNRYDFLERQ